MTASVLIVGGGVIGLLTAYQLAKEGIEVTLLEKNEDTGKESSWAGGGILSPLFPWRSDPAINALAHYSQQIYLELAEELLACSGIDPEYYKTGLYWLDLEDEEQALAWAKAYNKPLNKVDIVEVERAVSVLGEGYHSAIYMEDIANIRNPRLIAALKLALAKLPHVTIHNNSALAEVMLKGQKVIGIRTNQQEYLADNTILCTGAWTGDLLKHLAIELPVVPVKGQMILFKCAEDFLPTIILAKGRYVIPRRDGHILAGSTVEYVGYDKQPTNMALTSLQASAIELLPELSKAEVIQHWAGLRPESPNGIPYIGEMTNYKGLWLNCGHFRNGVILAPASCQLLTDLLLNRPPIVDPTPYLPTSRLYSNVPNAFAQR